MRRLSKRTRAAMRMERRAAELAVRMLELGERRDKMRRAEIIGWEMHNLSGLVPHDVPLTDLAASGWLAREIWCTHRREP